MEQRLEYWDDETDQECVTLLLIAKNKKLRLGWKWVDDGEALSLAARILNKDEELIKELFPKNWKGLLNWDEDRADLCRGILSWYVDRSLNVSITIVKGRKRRKK